MSGSYISVDLETTGLNPKLDKIIEIGAVKVIDGQIREQYHTLVAPRRSLDEEVTALTGINDQMLADAPAIEDCIGAFLEFAGELPLLGHHVIFDFSFLKRAAVNHNLVFKRKGIDTLKLCRRFMPEEEKKNLESACSYFGIRRELAHRAMADASDTHRLYCVLYEKYGAGEPDAFLEKDLIYKVKKEQNATKKQKEDLRYLLKYHKIELSIQIDYLSRNEASRIKDKIISQHGRIK
ncbi:MAG: 3'-5' exonuclease [Lachnospiraceae bacterium]